MLPTMLSPEEKARLVSSLLCVQKESYFGHTLIKLLLRTEPFIIEQIIINWISLHGSSIFFIFSEIFHVIGSLSPRLFVIYRSDIEFFDLKTSIAHFNWTPPLRQ